MHLETHLARLAASLQALYGEELSPDLADRVRVLGRTVQGRARLRIVAVPGRCPELEVAPVDAGTDPVTLTPWMLPGGLGAHKWRDRRLPAALAARGSVPLLVDASGEVLEAAWANVVVRVGAVWRTPPADGRLLPGTARARLLAEGHAVEESVMLDDLRGAEAVLLTSALRSVRARLD